MSCPDCEGLRACAPDCPAMADREARAAEDYCPECGGELAAREHGQGCGYVAEALADHAFDHHGGHR